jgi:hypothetical protein
VPREVLSKQFRNDRRDMQRIQRSREPQLNALHGVLRQSHVYVRALDLNPYEYLYKLNGAQQLLHFLQTNLTTLREHSSLTLHQLHLQEYLVQRSSDEVVIDRVLAAWSETRVDHWLHDLARLGALHQRDLMNPRAPVNLHDDDHDWDLLVLKMMDDQMKRMKRDGWMDDQNSAARNPGAVVSHPFPAPLFRFSLNLKTSLILLFIHKGK